MTSSPVRESKKARKPKNQPEHIKPLVEAEMERLLKLTELDFAVVDPNVYPEITE